MVGIDEILVHLKESLEEHASDLKKGNMFEPQYLKGKAFSNSFQNVAQTLAGKLGLEMRKEIRNDMPGPKDLYGSYQRVDYVYFSDTKQYIYLELETLDRAQLYLFSDIKLEGCKYTEENKLWYYLGTVKKHIIENKPIPRYFIWLLILPDKKVEDYSANLWDIKKWGKHHEYILHPSLKNLIFENPYRFYDHLIKTSARQFLTGEDEDLTIKGKSLIQYQDICELVFLTCTGNQIILSRGKDQFNREKEKIVKIEWPST